MGPSTRPLAPKPSNFVFSDRYLNRGLAFSPRTSILENWGKVIPKRPLQNAWISSSLPGAYSLNWLQGKSRISRPLSWNSS